MHIADPEQSAPLRSILTDAAHLFDSYTSRDVTFRNRIMVSPMCQYSSVDGMANDWHLVHLGSRAVGGAGLVMVEATAVTPDGRISPWDMGLWEDRQIEPLARIARFVGDQGAVPGIQIAHAGRKASTRRPWEGGGPVPPGEGGWQPLAPSPMPFRSNYPTPHELTDREIAALVSSFAQTARRALVAGFRVLELHAAHGYLIDEFLSPLANHRTDRYGGGFDNRIRFLCEIVQAVRGVWPENLPLFVRFSCTDWVLGGWTQQDSVRLARILAPEGVDLIDCSTGGMVPDARIPTGPSYQVPFAAEIRRGAGVPTAAVGLITEPAQADAIIREGQADLIALARAELRDPYWPIHAAKALGCDITWPPQYERAKD
jgi:2,4-dienoyl-CoA reductase-like NADH-dependent reductase (Old Yellow Enzyme family)